MDANKYAGSSRTLNALKVKENKLAGKTLQIIDVREEELGQRRELNLCLYLDGIEDVLSLNATNTKILIEAFGKETEQWLRKSIMLGLVKVDYQGRLVDGIQVHPVVA